jgi:hypothetical protein
MPDLFAIDLEHLPETDDDLHDYVWLMWGVNLPRAQVCPNHTAPFAAFAEAFFAREPVTIWKGSRGLAGKSFTLATLCNTEAVLLNAQVTILGGSSSQSQRVHEVSMEAWEHPGAPTQLLNGDPIQTMTRFHGNGWIRSLTASQKSARGPHPQRLRLDEIDEMDLAILEAAQGQPMSAVRRGRRIQTQTTMSSTHQYPDGTMTTMLKRAAENGFPVHEWCFRESCGIDDDPGWLLPEEVERKKREIPAHMWRVEYELGEPSIEGRVFGEEDMEFMFDATEGRKAGAASEMIEIEKPVRAGTYVTGIDWAKETDWTIISTWRTDCSPWRRASWCRVGRMSYQAIIAIANRRLVEYGGVLVHDSTGIGNVISDFLTHDKKLTRDVSMVGSRRVEMFNDYIAAVEQRSFKSCMIDYAHSEHKYLTLDDLFGRGHPPDSVVADALAWAGRGVRRRAVAPGNIEREGSSPSAIA